METTLRVFFSGKYNECYFMGNITGVIFWEIKYNGCYFGKYLGTILRVFISGKCKLNLTGVIFLGNITGVIFWKI